jgi:hypothetical protein
VVHKRAPPAPATPADQIDLQSKHIDAEVARARLLLDVREKIHAYRDNAVSRENVIATLDEIDRLLTLDRSVIHYDQFLPPPSSYNTPVNTPVPKRLRSDCSYGREECVTTIITCEKCDKFVCDLCARNLSIARFGDKEEDFHFCDEHAGDAPGIAVNVFNGGGLQVTTQQNLCMSENESADPNIKCDVCGLGADPKLVQPCDIHTFVHSFTCNRPVCVTCSRTKHPLRHHSDDDVERGFFCRQHTQPNCYVLDGFTFGQQASGANDEDHAQAYGYDLLNGE